MTPSQGIDLVPRIILMRHDMVCVRTAPTFGLCWAGTFHELRLNIPLKRPLALVNVHNINAPIYLLECRGISGRERAFRFSTGWVARAWTGRWTRSEPTHSLRAALVEPGRKREGCREEFYIRRSRRETRASTASAKSSCRRHDLEPSARPEMLSLIHI